MLKASQHAARKFTVKTCPWETGCVDGSMSSTTLGDNWGMVGFSRTEMGQKNPKEASAFRAAAANRSLNRLFSEQLQELTIKNLRNWRNRKRFAFWKSSRCKFPWAWNFCWGTTTVIYLVHVNSKTW